MRVKELVWVKDIDDAGAFMIKGQAEDIAKKLNCTVEAVGGGLLTAYTIKNHKGEYLKEF